MGLSGGADSTLCLLLALCCRRLRPDLPVTAVHCVHGLDAEDPEWRRHCEALCRRQAVTLTVVRLRIAPRRGESLEECARAARYQALSAAARGGVLLLGHQADDQVESLLLALKRGAGPRGLAGMQAVTRDARGVLARPLLAWPKLKVEATVRALGEDFVFDPSNASLRFERNFLRLQVLPLLRARFPGFMRAARRSAELCRQEHELARRAVAAVLPRCVSGRRLDLNGLDWDDAPLRAGVIRAFLAPALARPPSAAQVAAIAQLGRLSPDQRGVVRLCPPWEVRRYRQCLYLTAAVPPPPPGTTGLRPGAVLRRGGYVYRLQPCADAALAFPVGDAGVRLTFAAPGRLRLRPLTRPHSRELKKLLAEYAVPYWERPAVPLVTDAADGTILGMGGCFSARAAPPGAGMQLQREIAPEYAVGDDAIPPPGARMFDSENDG